MKRALPLLFLSLFFFLFTFSVYAEEDTGTDMELYGLEVEKLLNLFSGVLALVLFFLTYSGYRNSNNKRLQYVSIAFLLFAVKGLLISHELFFNEWSWVDPITSVFDFAILLMFFLGIVKK